jgi:hypothetical protein
VGAEVERFTAGALALARLSAGTLGWAPDTFWNATPQEPAACLGMDELHSAPPTRDEIAALMERDADGR